MNEFKCYTCKFMKGFKYFYPPHDVWITGIVCAIFQKQKTENVFRAVGNKNKYNDCKDYKKK
jgi:hypothetical protein